MENSKSDFIFRFPFSVNYLFSQKLRILLSILQCKFLQKVKTEILK
jgi:hypothetical protein